MNALTTKQLFTIAKSIAYMRDRAERISSEFTGRAKENYLNEIEHLGSILDVIKGVQDDLLASSTLPEKMHATIEIKL